jgi:hypothetical protein
MSECDGRRPGGSVRGPGDIGKIKDAGVFGPMDQVGGGEAVEVGLLSVIKGEGGEDPVLVGEDVCVGVGVPAWKDGIAGVCILIC